MIDFHCHVDLYDEPLKLLDEIDKRGTYVLAVTTTPRAWPVTKKMVDGRSRVRAAVGLHPELVGERYSEIAFLEHLIAETDYVGEVGLDGSKHLASSFDLQLKAFHRICARCEQLGGKTLSIHSRHAATAVLDVLEQYPDVGTPILHWFSGSVKEIRRAIDLCCWFSVGPAMLRGEKGREYLKLIPRDYILPETDGPFARNGNGPLYPWDASSVVNSIAKSWECDVEFTKDALHKNLRTIGQITKNR